MERYLSCGETIAAWKSIECIIGAAVRRTPGTGSSLRLVIEKRILSPTFARTVGPGTWSPKVQALNFTPGAISMILWVLSSRMTLTGEASSGLISGAMLREAPSAKAPVWRSALTLAGVGFRSIFEMSYLSATAAGGGGVWGLQAARPRAANATTNSLLVFTFL